MAGSSETMSLLHFPALCDRAFGPLLRSHGFLPTEREVDPLYSRLAYANGGRYIAITANVDPRDAPFHCNLALGEGGREMPERDWNAIALWRLVRDRAPESVPPGQELYGITAVEDIPAIVARMAADLSEHASDFLRGELERFRHVRAAQTREREPYTIWEPGEEGSYIRRPDPVSAALKARFSQAE